MANFFINATCGGGSSVFRFLSDSYFANYQLYSERKFQLSWLAKIVFYASYCSLTARKQKHDVNLYTKFGPNYPLEEFFLLQHILYGFK